MHQQELHQHITQCCCILCHAQLRPLTSVLLTCRLFERELNYIINHAKDEYILLDLTFVNLMTTLQDKLPTVKGFIILTDRQHMPSDCKLRNVMCYEALLEVQQYRTLKHLQRLQS